MRSNDPRLFRSQENRRPSESHLERLFLENDFHSFARELRTGEAPLT